MNICEFRRVFIYHSPQYPGFTSWCGLWIMFWFATTAISGTTDEGRSWTDAEIPEWNLKSFQGGKQCRRYNCGTAYYPRSVQMASGEVLCVGHTGGDDPYAGGGQSIVGVRFLCGDLIPFADMGRRWRKA